MINSLVIESAIALFENDAAEEAIPHANDIMQFASSDDWKDTYCDALYELGEVIRAFIKRNPRYIKTLELWI